MGSLWIKIQSYKMIYGVDKKWGEVQVEIKSIF